jgi:hypothetical protein
MSIEEAPGTRLRRVIREYDALAAEARAGTNRHDRQAGRPLRPALCGYGVSFNVLRVHARGGARIPVISRTFQSGGRPTQERADDVPVRPRPISGTRLESPRAPLIVAASRHGRHTAGIIGAFSWRHPPHRARVAGPPQRDSPASLRLWRSWRLLQGGGNERRARAHRERLDAIAIHAPDCPRGRGYSADDSRRCGGTYECPRCDRTFGWCIGAHDDTPALCDECANTIQADAGAA